MIYDNPGQTCNKLWSYLDSVAKSLVNGTGLRIIYWDKEIEHFGALRKSISFPFYSSFLKNHCHWLVKTVFWFFGTRAVKGLFGRLGESRGFVQGWKRRDSHKYYPQIPERIREVFRPDEEIVSEVEKVFSRYRKEGFFIIGVHVRRGDYKNWEEGTYFLEHEQYASLMAQVAALYSGRKLCFFISSNEAYPESVYSSFTLIPAGFSTAVHDLYGLSLCDRIIGPLSTFSRWASFYGRAPLCFVNRDTVISSDDDFSAIAHFYKFENGRTIPNLTDKKIN